MYIGPDTLMPVASAFAAIAGVALMFGRRTVAALRTTVQVLAQRFSKR
ncbi:MAG: hypothetical protein H7Z74_08530 [Anaerolineae bacterium]|nr:hypothetical protein [Gemmatimonadaceae bacterium]